MAEGRSDATVLVAADLRELRERYVDGLDDEYDVVSAASAGSVRDALAEGVDAAVLDAALFDAPVAVVAENLRADFDCRVAVSSVGDAGGRAVDASLDKPVSGSELLATVQRLVARREYVAAVSELHDACERRRERLGGDVDGDENVAGDAATAVDRTLARADAAAAELDGGDFRAVFDDL